jgi:hypothetical protein
MDYRSRFLKIADANPELSMGDDASLPSMPDAPSLIDYFILRFDTIDHLLQSARLALINGQSEKVIMACLLHDIAVCGFIRGDHGFWGEQMIAPYVDEEISWSVRVHQALRFFPDETVGYTYPEAYTKYFGSDYKPDDYIVREYEAARNHRYYMTARMITIYDIYSFDPNVKVDLHEFTDIIGRHWRQPKEGLGFDNTIASHIWRTIRRPNKFL